MASDGFRWLPMALPKASKGFSKSSDDRAVSSAYTQESCLGSSLSLHPEHIDKCRTNTWLRGVVHLCVPPQVIAADCG